MSFLNVHYVVGVALALGAVASAAERRDDFTAAQYIEMANRLDQAWKRISTVFYSPKTHLFYASPVDRVAPASLFENGFLDPEKHKVGYGAGMADCPIYSGLLISMLADRYDVMRDGALAARALEVFKGLKTCATAHGVPGFVARGVCAEDGKSICITSSRDQVTHFVHGLWRYYHSPLCTEETKAEIRTLLKDMAERMIRNVTPENDYDFLRADGTRDPRGICRMWKVRPHEAARLPMIYAAAWDVTRDEKYYRLYREYLVPAVEETLTLPSVPPAQVRAFMPTYTLLQMQTSLELLLELETDAAMKGKLVDAMQPVARMAAERAVRINGGEEKSSLCACGEAALAQLMAKDFAFTGEQKTLLYTSIMESDMARIGTCRTAHLLAAYWRARKLGILTKP